jgi:hypothetical protein
MHAMPTPSIAPIEPLDELLPTDRWTLRRIESIRLVLNLPADAAGYSAAAACARASSLESLDMIGLTVALTDDLLRPVEDETDEDE